MPPEATATDGSAKPPRRRRKRLAIVAGIALFATTITAGYILRGGPETRIFAPSGPSANIVAVYFSGDMGLRFGIGPVVANALSRHGIATIGKDSATLFRSHRSAAEVNAIVAGAVEAAAARAPGKRIVLIGQSFGADILASGLPSLPQRDRERIARTILVVPASTAYFRADPVGVAYLGKPDAFPAVALRGASGPPITCIQGALETDSLCPLLPASAHRVVLPGGHFLRNDSDLLSATIIGQLDAMVPGTIPRPDGI